MTKEVDFKDALERAKAIASKFFQDPPRDKARIKRLLDRLQTIWEQNPDYRLGQIITNASLEIRGDNDPFYIEDERIMNAIETAFNK